MISVINFFLPGLAKRRKLRSEGISIERNGRDEHIVSHLGRRAAINTELCSGDLDFIIYSSSVTRWQPPHQDQPMTETDKSAIINKMKRYFDVMGSRYRVE